MPSHDAIGHRRIPGVFRSHDHHNQDDDAARQIFESFECSLPVDMETNLKGDFGLIACSSDMC